MVHLWLESHCVEEDVPVHHRDQVFVSVVDRPDQKVLSGFHFYIFPCPLRSADVAALLGGSGRQVHVGAEIVLLSNVATSLRCRTTICILHRIVS
jgi:hypothetical protein